MAVLVSIGPRPFRHGNIADEHKNDDPAKAVSIGPRPFRHGNVLILLLVGTAMAFQLGHVLSDMEI